MRLTYKSNRSILGFAVPAVLGLMALLYASPVHAYPVLGQDIYYHGGALQFEVMESEAAYISEIYLFTSTGSVFLANSKNTGAVIYIANPGTIGLNPEDEFILGIHVVNTGNDFFTGGAYDNPDGVVHASVNYLDNHIALIGFEDLFGGGDLDYNDAIIKVLGDIGISQVPEPFSLLLLGSGFVGLSLLRRKTTRN